MEYNIEIIRNSIKIIYEDNHLLVVEKPPNMLTQRDNTGDADLLSLLKEDLKFRYNKPGDAFLGLVHRLDRPVGGVMVFAKTSKGASRVSEQIRSGSFKKTYYAVVHGMPLKSPGILEHYLEKDEETNTVRVVSSDSGKGKLARLGYEVVESREGLSLVKVDLHTGRPHQIRVQFSSSNNPLYGDKKYGRLDDKSQKQLALWSSSIILKHPTLQNELVFISKPPAIYPWNIFSLY